MIRRFICLLFGLLVGIESVVVYLTLASVCLRSVAEQYPPVGEFGMPQDPVLACMLLAFCGLSVAWAAGLFFGTNLAARLILRQ
jgi:hypothetical protein